MNIGEEINKGKFTFAMMKADGMANNKAYYDFVQQVNVAELKIIYEGDVILAEKDLREQYAHHAERDFFESFIEYMLGKGEVLKHIHQTEPKYEHMGNTTFIIYGKNAITKVRTILGETDIDIAKKNSPNSMRGKYGYKDENNMYTVFHATDKPSDFLGEIENKLPNLDLEECIINSLKSK